MSLTTEGSATGAAAGPEAIQALRATQAAADRRALAASMLGATSARGATRHHIPRKVYLWALAAGSGIGLVVVGGVQLLGQPASDTQRAISACEQSATTLAGPSAPVTFADVRARRTAAGSYSVNGTMGSPDSGLQAAWACTASAQGATWDAQATLL